eukprot:scaffold41182_cov39-Tisochrysis_lutea.AAC.4
MMDAREDCKSDEAAENCTTSTTGVRRAGSKKALTSAGSSIMPIMDAPRKIAASLRCDEVAV